MAKKTIAVDIDEVLAKHNLALSQWHNESFGTTHTTSAYTTDYWENVWGVSADEAERRAVAFYETDAHLRFELVDGAREALQVLRGIHDLQVVTVRRKRAIESTYTWIEKHFPDTFKDVHFVHYWDANDRTTKADICKRIGASVLVDDSLKHCRLAAEQGMEAILFGDYAWNQAPELPYNVQRRKNWQEVIEVLA